ncbi:MAG: M20/M25/M40 family metallo-hydrolase, partial [Bacteroidota bacterium]
ASQGMIIKLEGRTSHASEPEKGNSPAAAVTDIIRFFSETASKKNLHAGTFATVIYVKIGEIAFGTSPGMAEVMATLRSPSDAGLKELSENALETIRGIAENYNLNYELAWTEEFAAVRNDLQCTEAVEKAAIHNGYEIIKMERPFRWSEDFGLYTQSYKGALFGLGAGISAPSLHSPDYEFPDDLIEPGIRMFFTALSSLL